MIKTFPSLLESEETFQNVQYNIVSVILVILLYYGYFWIIFFENSRNFFIRFKNKKKDNTEMNKIFLNFN